MPQHDLAAFDDLEDGVPVNAMAGERAILLIRRGDSVAALTHECPHLGLPLSKGVVQGNMLICAFHHACFDIATGQQAEPPGHGDLTRFAVELRDGRVLVDVPEDAPTYPTPSTSRQATDARRVVVVGAGAAADEAVQTLREGGFDGAIAMMSPEDRAPYDRTMLSKAVLAGGKTVDDLTLTDPDRLAELGVTRITGRVTSVQPGRVTLDDGGHHPWDDLLIAPGGIARRLPVPGADMSGVHTLRSAEEAQAIATAVSGARKVVLIGGGFIGLEGALSLAKRGLEVTVLMREEVPLARILGEEVGRAIRAEHEAAGVTFRPGAEIYAITGDDTARAVALKDGTEIPADLVIMAVGVEPATAGIDGLPLTEDGGVAVGRDLSVPGLPGARVLGDCARAPTPFGPARIEHWRVACQHGRRAAREILAAMGKGVAPETADIPFFWTALARQYRYLGHAGEWDKIVFDGDPAGPFLARYLKDGHVVAALGAGRDADLAALHLEMRAAGGPVPA